ncbi:hypothetical protein E2C01_011181 [Portunus trituberculatus]|uniref:Uncharacterized protein n=1 Tax=Portunus trituberculatus TaxID=210409 RepID=A0A5B7DAQ4_PORTR|nr:hypothetical protein [Portunus trituberculatus]
MHFTRSDYEDDLKHRLLGTETPKSHRLLTDATVPSLNLPQVAYWSPNQSTHYGAMSELMDRSSGRTETTAHSTHRESVTTTP